MFWVYLLLNTKFAVKSWYVIYFAKDKKALFFISLSMFSFFIRLFYSLKKHFLSISYANMSVVYIQNKILLTYSDVAIVFIYSTKNIYSYTQIRIRLFVNEWF